MGLFDYMFDPQTMNYQGGGGLFDGLFSSRWAPVDESSVPNAWGGWPGLKPGGSQVASPAPPEQNSFGQTMAYSEPSAPQFPIQPAGGMLPRQTPGYYGGSPSTNPLLAPQDPLNRPAPQSPRQQPPVPPSWPPGGPDFQGQQPSPGIGDRMGAGLQGAGGSFFSGGGPIGALVNLFGGLATGKRTDPQGVANEEAIRMYKFLQTKEGGGLSPAQAQGVVMHPELAKEYYKGLVNSPPIFAPDGTILQQGTFGAPPNVVGSAPKPEMKERYNPTTGRMELTAVTPPTIGNPRMSVTTPGGGLPGQGSAPRLPGQQDVSFATAPSVGEKKTQEGVAEANVADLKTINTQALAASNQRTIFQRMRQLNEMPGLGQGGLAPIQQTFRSAMVSLGLKKDVNNIKPGEEFNSLASSLTLEATGGSLGNQISDGDRKFMAARIPSLENTKEGRTEMLQTLELLAQRKVDIAKEATKYRMLHGGDLDGFQTYIADWAEQHPLFKDRPAVTMTAPSAPGAPSIPPPPKGFVVQ